MKQIITKKEKNSPCTKQTMTIEGQKFGLQNKLRLCWEQNFGPSNKSQLERNEQIVSVHRRKHQLQRGQAAKQNQYYMWNKKSTKGTQI
jgi:hypothetical protein